MSKKNRKLLIVKVGSDERPASTEDIKHTKKLLKKLQKKGRVLRGYDLIVTHHAIDFDFLSVP
jgi:hypothetical protein